MRTILIALVCSMAVACGAWIGRIQASSATTAGAFALMALLGTTMLGCAATWIGWLSRARDPARAERWATVMICALLVCAGLLRGASVGPAEQASGSARAVRRGIEAERLRELEVVGASEPGPRCTLRLRRAGPGPSGARAGVVRVEAPPSACPRWAGERVAVLARDLRGGRLPRVEESGEERIELLGERSVWLRPSQPTSWGDRLARGYWWWVATSRERAWAISRGDRSLRLSAAVALGLRSALEPEEREALRRAGLGHLIAVSGLQVALAGLWLQVLARRLALLLGLTPRTSCVVAWLPLLAYVGLTGAAAPAVRSALMLMAVDLGVVIGRPTHGPTLLAMTAAAMLLVEPAWLFDVGFQLSLAAMAALVTSPRDAGVLLTSWRVTWITAPLTLIHFDAAPLHGLIGNVLGLPLFALLMPVSLIGWLLLGSIGELALAPTRWFAEPLMDLVELLAELPSADAKLLVWAAIVLLLLDGIRRIWSARRAAAMQAVEPTRASAWIPPWWIAAWLLVVAAPRAWAPPGLVSQLGPAEFEWAAVGTVHARTLVIPSSASWLQRACLVRPAGSPRELAAILEQLGVERLSFVGERLPAAEEHQVTRHYEGVDARVEQLRDALDRLDIEVESIDEAAGCSEPPPAQVREALRACQARHGGQGRVSVVREREVVRCWFEDRWIELPELRRDSSASGPDTLPQ